MATTWHHHRRILWTAVVSVLIGGTIGCPQSGRDDTTGRSADSVQEASPPWACETHTTLARMTPLSATDMMGALRALSPQRALTETDLDSLGLTPGLVGTRSVGPQDNAMVWRSPQYHDCQDLIVARGGVRQYTTRAGIMATAQTAWLRDEDFVSNPGVGYRLAFVRRLAGGNYQNLLLDADSACIYVGAGDDDITAPWWAAVRECDGPTTQRESIPTSRILAVTRLTYPGHSFEFGDYPPVARWEWDDSLQVQAYGFKCATGWCVAGVEPPTVDMSEYGPSAQGVIHGWRDEQYLADTTAVNPADGRPSDEYAVLVPQPMLDGLTPDSLMKPNPVRVGFIQARQGGAGSRYGGKYGFNGRGRYPVRLGGGITPGGSGQPDTTRIRVMHPTNGSQRDRTALIHVLGVPTVATARWAWSLDDEEQWWRCPDGCCESVGDEDGGGLS